MPVGKEKPAGGYRAGKKGTYGCNGYPTVSADGTVHGCHPTKGAAAAQARAIWASVNSKSMGKASFALGDFVMFSDDDEIKAGRIEHIMTEGTLGIPGSEYAMEATENDPVMSVRIFEEEDGAWEETAYSIGLRMSEAVKIESLMVSTDVVMEMTGTPVPEQSGNAVSEYEYTTEKRERSMATRERLAETGAAMPDGSYPIVTAEDLRNAIQAVGRAKDYNAAKQHIMRRARALGMTSMLPEDWRNKAVKTSWAGSIFDLNPFVKRD